MSGCLDDALLSERGSRANMRAYGRGKRQQRLHTDGEQYRYLGTVILQKEAGKREAERRKAQTDQTRHTIDATLQRIGRHG